jgi:hypothetical protein
METSMANKSIKAAIAQRPDVRDSMHNPKLINSGFVLDIDPQLLPNGVT